MKDRIWTVVVMKNSDPDNKLGAFVRGGTEDEAFETVLQMAGWKKKGCSGRIVEVLEEIPECEIGVTVQITERTWGLDGRENRECASYWYVRHVNENSQGGGRGTIVGAEKMGEAIEKGVCVLRPKRNGSIEAWKAKCGAGVGQIFEILPDGTWKAVL